MVSAQQTEADFVNIDSNAFYSNLVLLCWQLLSSSHVNCLLHTHFFFFLLLFPILPFFILPFPVFFFFYILYPNINTSYFFMFSPFFKKSDGALGFDNNDLFSKF